MARAQGKKATVSAPRPRGSLSRDEIVEAGLLIAKRDELTPINGYDTIDRTLIE